MNSRVAEILSSYKEWYNDKDEETIELDKCGEDLLPTLRTTLTALLSPQPPSDKITNLARTLSSLFSLASTAINTSNPKEVSFHWRLLYTDTSILHSLLDFISHPHSHPNGSEEEEEKEEEFWKESIKRLDMAIIISGAPGSSRLDIIHSLISLIQTTHLPSPPLLPSFLSSFPSPSTSAPTNPPPPIPTTLPIPLLNPAPSLLAFTLTHSSNPFIIPSFSSLPSPSPASHNQSHKWSSPQYLKSVSGRGRIVPVEVGHDYTHEEWTQRIVEWDYFVDSLFSPTPPTPQDKESEILYLAQHTLLTQFPSLLKDIIIPDYVYASLDPPSESGYRPPMNKEQLVINAWFGPKGTVSPAHTDPYYNCYTQIIGRKTIFLSPPSSLSPSLSSSSSSSNTSNTLSFNVFSPQTREEEKKKIPKESMSATLEEGDMLFIPVGWWHAMKSESVSFSVSIWF